MTGQHFKELFETICMTKHVKKAVVYRYLGLSQMMVNNYERNGLPIQLKPMIMAKLKTFLFSDLGGTYESDRRAI